MTRARVFAGVGNSRPDSPWRRRMVKVGFGKEVRWERDISYYQPAPLDGRKRNVSRVEYQSLEILWGGEGVDRLACLLIREPLSPWPYDA